MRWPVCWVTVEAFTSAALHQGADSLAVAIGCYLTKIVALTAPSFIEA